MRPLGLSKDEKSDLLEFLGTLNGSQAPVSVPPLFVNPQTAHR
jgi:hypothetical protein